MQGAGFYNSNSAMQAAGIAAALSFWQDACQSVAIGDEPLVIADYGCSQGRNSTAPIGAAIDVVRRRCGQDKPIEVFHTDLPGNDFTSLFETLLEDPSSYMAGRTAIFPAAIGRSFYEPLIAPGRVHLGWSTWSMQWLSRCPAAVPDHILAGLSRTANVIAAVEAQQAADWHDLLERRSVELRSGGKLLLGYTARLPEDSGWEWLLGELWASLEEMSRDGVIAAADLPGVTIPIGLRTLAQIREPFERSGIFAGLRLERCELLKIADPHWDDFARTGNAGEFAARHAGTTRAWAGPTIAGLMPAEHGRDRLVDDLFARFAARIEAAPQGHEPYMAVMLVTKEL